MKQKISIRDYLPDDVHALANIYFNTIHRINIQHYTQAQVDAWAPKSSLESDGWAKKFVRTKPIVAVVNNTIVGFAEFEPNGHIDCFYIHHEWIGQGIGTALMTHIFAIAKNQHIDCIFAEVSITAKPFFERQGFVVLTEQTIVRKGIELINYKMERHLSHPHKQEINFEITKNPTSQDLDFLTQKINEEAVGYGSAHPFAIFIRDKNGDILAGCNGSVFFGSIYTDQLWVHPAHRKMGLGRYLMEKVHEYGKTQGCTMTTVATMNFQAPQFYQKLGYQIEFTRLGLKDNISILFMRKDL